MERVFTGLKPTGRLTLGNYLGAIRPLQDLASQPDRDVLVCVADLHALTVEHNPANVRSLTSELAATLIACGIGDQGTLFVQSSVTQHTELSYLLECVATYGEMRRMIQFKEKSSGQDSTRLSLLTYPALMAADILAYQTDIVPVGDDQKQHLELTITVARRFNAEYGPVFTVPRMVTPAQGARVKDLRDPKSKMGKTNADPAGIIYLMDDPDAIRTKVRKAVTDSDPSLTFDAEDRPGVANLATIIGALQGQDPAECLDGLKGSRELKQLATDVIIDTVDPIRRKCLDLQNTNSDHLGEVLSQGGDAVRPLAEATTVATKQALGLLAV